MKDFNVYDFSKQCPIARSVENALNNCESASRNLNNLSEVLKDIVPEKFFGACLLYWSEAEYYDERNQVAVLVSREIVKKFSRSPFLNKNGLSDKTLNEAFGFTHFAHRYIQGQLFKVILEHLRQTGNVIYQWHEEQKFVIDAKNDIAIPYGKHIKR